MRVLQCSYGWFAIEYTSQSVCHPGIIFLIITMAGLQEHIPAILLWRSGVNFPYYVWYVKHTPAIMFCLQMVNFLYYCIV